MGRKIQIHGNFLFIGTVFINLGLVRDIIADDLNSNHTLFVYRYDDSGKAAEFQRVQYKRDSLISEVKRSLSFED